MKMKKAIICAILAGLLTTSAFAQEVNTSIDLDTRDVTVSGIFEESAFNRMISIEVKAKEDPTKMYYIGTFAPNADGSYSFKFRMPEEAETGYYNITLGVYGKEETVKEMYFSKKADIDALLAIINSKDSSAADIREAIENSMNVLDIPKSWYDKLDNAGKDAIAKALFDGREYAGLTLARDVAYTELAVQSFRCAKDAKEIGEAMTYFADIYNINAENAKCFELYQKLGTTETEIAANQEKARLNMANADCVGVAGVLKAYDEGTLLTAINIAKDPAQVKSYLDSDAYRSVYSFDMSTYDKSNKEKTVKYIYDLNTVFKTMTELEKAISDAYKAQNTNTSGAGSNGGGSSSSKGGGITNYAPGTPVIPNNNENNENTDNTADSFTDLAQAEWAREAIVYLADKKVVSGIAEENGTFRFEPNSLVTREQFVKMLAQAFGLIDDDAECEFDDMQSGHWAYNAVASAYKKGIVSGISDSEFGTGKLITRQDMAVMAYKAAKAAGYELLNESEASFSDGDLISDYAKESVATMNANGIINGYPDGRFAPAETATRAQAAQVIYTIIK